MPLSFLGASGRPPVQGCGNRHILRDVNPQRLIVAITGATGAIYGVRLLEMLREAAVETHLVISPWGRRTLLHETTYTVDQVQRLATVTYVPNDQGAAISSGSFLTMGMAIVPCSMRTLACGRARAWRQPHPSRRRRGAEGAPQAAPCAARSAAERHSPREHAEALADGRRHLPADARLLSASRTDRRSS